MASQDARILQKQKFDGKVAPSTVSNCPPHTTQGNSMKTPSEMELAVCQGIRHFEEESRGRAPTSICAHLIGDCLLVRLQGVLTPAEQQLAKSAPPGRGRDLVKQVRTHLIETATPLLQALVQGITGVPVISLHHDISTRTGESVILFTLSAPPFANAKKK